MAGEKTSRRRENNLLPFLYIISGSHFSCPSPALLFLQINDYELGHKKRNAKQCARQREVLFCRANNRAVRSLIDADD
jgi:hypothetical protein